MILNIFLSVQIYIKNLMIETMNRPYHNGPAPATDGYSHIWQVSTLFGSDG